MPVKSGVKPKDTAIVKNFNLVKKNNLPPREIKKVAKVALTDTPDENIKTPRRRGPIKIPAGENLLNDMRWVYATSKGRKRLKELMKDDKQFLFMVKEMMKMESAQMIAKTRIRVDEEDSDRTVFVVLKGLEDEVKMDEALQQTEREGGEIKIAINPDGSEYKEE